MNRTVGGVVVVTGLTLGWGLAACGSSPAGAEAAEDAPTSTGTDENEHRHEGGNQAAGGTAGAGNAAAGSTGAGGSEAGVGGAADAESCDAVVYSWDGASVGLVAPPTPGRCEGAVAKVCVAGSGQPTGTMAATACSQDETCEEYEAQVIASVDSSEPGQGLSFAALGEPFLWASCVGKDVKKIAFSFDPQAGFVPAKGEGPRCEGSNRERPFPLPLPPPVPSVTVVTTPLPAVRVGTTAGYWVVEPCAPDEECVTDLAETAAFCAPKDAKPCTEARCQGASFIGCEDGFEKPLVDCAAQDGQECFVSPATCPNAPSQRASCQPPGTLACVPLVEPASCSADGTQRFSCDPDTCARAPASCAAGTSCHAPAGAGASCVPDGFACEPSSFVSSCSGTIVAHCDSSGTRQSFDCASQGLVCVVGTDPQTGVASAGCALPAQTACAASETAPLLCAGKRAEYCCGDWQGPINVEGALPGFVCAPGYRVALSCQVCGFDPFAQRVACALP
jgi:hypothetical protein